MMLNYVNSQNMKKKVYLTPEAELLEWAMEENFLASFTQDKDIPDLEEEDGWGNSIWG